MLYMQWILLFIIIFPFFAYRWYEKIEKHHSRDILKMEGKYSYAQSLLISKYIIPDRNNSCRMHMHNVKNDYIVGKAYLEAAQRTGHVQFAIVSLIMSILFVIGELIVAYGLDWESTKTIHCSESNIENSLNSIINTQPQQ